MVGKNSSMEGMDRQVVAAADVQTQDQRCPKEPVVALTTIHRCLLALACAKKSCGKEDRAITVQPAGEPKEIEDSCNNCPS